MQVELGSFSWLLRRKLEDVGSLNTEICTQDKTMMSRLQCSTLFYNARYGAQARSRAAVTKILNDHLVLVLRCVDWTQCDPLRDFLGIDKSRPYTVALKGFAALVRLLRKRSQRRPMRLDPTAKQEVRKRLLGRFRKLSDRLPMVWNVAQACASVATSGSIHGLANVMSIHKLISDIEAARLEPEELEILDNTMRGKGCVTLARGGAGALFLQREGAEKLPKVVFMHARVVDDVGILARIYTDHLMQRIYSPATQPEPESEPQLHHHQHHQHNHHRKHQHQHQHQHQHHRRLSARSPSESEVLLDECMGRVADQLIAKMASTFVYFEILKLFADL